MRSLALFAVRSLALAALLAASACTLVLDADRHQSDAVPVAATEFCAELAALACGAVRDCCNQPALDVDMCIRNASIECANDLGALAIDPRTGYDPGLAGLALAEARALASTCDPAFETWRLSPLGVQRALAGTIPVGEPCDPNFLDVPNLFACEGDAVCTQMGTVANPMWVCAPSIPLDGECSLDALCEPGLRCSAPIQLLNTGTCLPLKELGEPCGRGSECVTNVCDTTCRDATVDEAYCGN